MLMMNDLGSMAAGMMPFDPMCGGLYEQQPPKPRFIFKMPRVVPDQKNKFETDELFRRLSRESDFLVTVHFYAQGSYQRGLGGNSILNISQPSVSRSISSVTNAINQRLLRRWVKFPMTTVERQKGREKFEAAPQPFEGTLGAIDCTHINILAPVVHEEAYVNHHGNHSLNVQAVRYTGYRDRPHEERQSRFQIGCREGHVDIAFTATGTNLQLMFTPNMPIPSYHQFANGTCNFEKERGMVHILSHFIMNGVCVRWKGRIDLDKLDGIGCLEFDEERAMIENRMLQEQIERYNDRIREYQDKPRGYRNQERGVTDSDLDVKRRLNY